MYVYLVVFAVLFYFVLIKCIFDRHRHALIKSLKRTTNVSSETETDGADVRALVVTAHPDDECMFFAPTIIRLNELNASVHLLCLSEGNYYNRGAQRREELFSSSAVLGIPASRVTIIDHKKLPDDPKAEWSVSLVSSAVLKHITAHAINMVVTFDGRGVSGHANHVAIYKAVRVCAALPGDSWPSKEVHLLPRPSLQLVSTITSPLCCWFKGLQASQSCHAASSHSASVVSVPLHHPLKVHVH
ncbi:N-acetylglucosaminyl-phosphatidylinositol de-N-acetylase isoform X2 [Girardinichthys multiradiatus]|uniref:N-acetylglucosaminyl-phosphatidylinositol de-N-acetylase isoform X2 n=1 Tax=Girardinichthys multiradiatus TaxID=208333 RepID=UPI001FABC478|nr:N-acetylglucosaminyl-phosphatidylinositol de-N-acetylase isoform X2 [Girardinichthys multiradiatus]